MATTFHELSRPLVPDEQSEYRNFLVGEQYNEWAKKFGVNPYDFDRANPITPESVDELMHAIEDLCTGSGGEASYTTYLFSHGTHEDGSPEFEVMFNEANFAWGFGPGLLDITPAKVTNIRREERFGFGIKEPLGKYVVDDTFFIDVRTGLPSVYRRMIPTRGDHNYQTAIKPANALDAAAALAVVQQMRSTVETGTKLPIYVEIGYGMDPAATLGNREFGSKQYVGIDAVIGQYALQGDMPYAEALRGETEQLAARVKDERPGEHIRFSVADGEQLDMPTGSVREVFMSNVLNAPDISLDDKRRLLAETSRVLEKDGRLVLRVNWHQDDWSPKMMRAFLEDNGAFIVKEAHPGQLSHTLLEKQYGTQQTVQAPEGYYLICMLRSS